MRAKLTYESIIDILKPKSKEEIKKDLLKLSKRDKELLLIDAAFENKIEIVKLLLKAGVNVNAQDETGNTSLIYAAYGENKKMIKILLDADADINIKDNYGNTIFDIGVPDNLIQFIFLNKK